MIGGFGSMDLLLFKGGILYLGFHVDFPGCSPKYLWKQVGLIRSCWSMRTVFWDWDRANLETFFVELPNDSHHSQHTICPDFKWWDSNFFFDHLRVATCSNLWRNSPPNFRRTCGNAQLLDGKITWHLLGGSPPSMFHLCSWGLRRQGIGGLEVGWRSVVVSGIKFCPTCRRWHVPELKVSWSCNRWMDGKRSDFWG